MTVAKNPSIQDLFESMRSGSENSATSASPRPMLEAQALELYDRWARFHAPSDLKPGDLCLEKRGLGRTKVKHRTDNLMIIWRLLDADDVIDRLLIAELFNHGLEGTSRPDCLVGRLDDDCGAVALMAHERAHLERWVPDTDGKNQSRKREPRK